MSGEKRLFSEGIPTSSTSKLLHTAWAPTRQEHGAVGGATTTKLFKKAGDGERPNKCVQKAQIKSEKNGNNGCIIKGLNHNEIQCYTH